MKQQGLLARDTVVSAALTATLPLCFQMTPMVDARLREPLNRVRLLSVPRHTLEATHLLYEGTFGQVYRGQWRARPGHQEDTIVKTVSGK